MDPNGVDILLVEDDPGDVELTLQVLKQYNPATSIQFARDGAEALEYLFCRGVHSGREQISPRMVLLDLKLPKIDGLEVLAAIREDARTSKLPVVILTSSREQQDIVAGYRLHVNSYIQKPVSLEQFRESIRQIGLYWAPSDPPPAQARR